MTRVFVGLLTLCFVTTIAVFFVVKPVVDLFLFISSSSNGTTFHLLPYIYKCCFS